jgi:hypothetical protein
MIVGLVISSAFYAMTFTIRGAIALRGRRASK